MLLLTPTAQAATLRVLTYNIHHGVGNDSALDLSRIASVISAANPDIVSLQEVDNGVPRSNSINQVARLAELTGMQSYFGKARNLNGGSVGNGVLIRSGIDIVNTQNFALPNPDATEPRAVAQLGLSLDSNPATVEFNFFATHFAHDSTSGRQQSATYINNLVASSSTPSILAGDMNFNPGSTAFNIIDNQWLDATNINNSGKNRANQIDYVFYRSSSQWDITTAGQFIINADDQCRFRPSSAPGRPRTHQRLARLGTRLERQHRRRHVVQLRLRHRQRQRQASAIFRPIPGALCTTPADRTSSSATTPMPRSAAAPIARSAHSASAPTRPTRSSTAETATATVTASGTMGLLITSDTDSSGDLMIGEGGQTGTLNWNGSGTLEAQGRLRVGQGGTGTFNQAAGVVIAGNTAGSFRFLAIGLDPGSTGTYNLNGGVLRPSGGFAGTQFRQTLVGDNGATGTLNVGNDIGTAATAAIESNDDLIIGRAGGTGTLRVRSDGRIELRTSSNQAEFLIGENANGSVIQTGGTVTSDALVRIGNGATGIGHYAISGGTLATGTDGVATFQIARSGATGTLRVSGTATVSHGAELVIADDANTGSTGRLELIGNQASFQIGQLDNVTGGANGMRETIRWEADANGVTPIVVTGAGALTSNRVRLQSASELAANSGAAATLTGDGVSLELDLSAINSSRTLTLIDNLSSDPIHGFFENGITTNLYAEGASLNGTGFNGTVNISYIGGSGNDVVLNLIAAPISGDHNADGIVDAADYVVWRNTDSAQPPRLHRLAQQLRCNFGLRPISQHSRSRTFHVATHSSGIHVVP